MSSNTHGSKAVSTTAWTTASTVATTVHLQKLRQPHRDSPETQTLYSSNGRANGRRRDGDEDSGRQRRWTSTTTTTTTTTIDDDQQRRRRSTTPRPSTAIGDQDDGGKNSQPTSYSLYIYVCTIVIAHDKRHIIGSLVNIVEVVVIIIFLPLLNFISRTSPH